MQMKLTAREQDYLGGQRIGRLATVDVDGMPQNNPVGFFLDAGAPRIDIGGTAMGSTRKFHNVEATGVAALVVDDVVEGERWQVRGIEVRGRAEALRDVEPPGPGYSREIIRLTPTWIGSWGIEPAPGLTVRHAS